MNDDGKDVKRLTNDNFEDSYPSFSPDGKKIIFQSQRTKKIQLIIMNIDGSEQKVLLPKEQFDLLNINSQTSSDGPSSRAPKIEIGDNNEFSPIFSQDGKKMYFIMNNYITPPEVYSYEFESGNLMKITEDNSGSKNKLYKDDYIHISPYNSKLIISTLSDQDNMRKRIFFISDMNGENRTQLIDWEQNIWFPSWMDFN